MPIKVKFTATVETDKKITTGTFYVISGSYDSLLSYEPWEWTDAQETSFQTLKQTLTSETVMTFFDPAKETELWVDASPVGLAAVMIQ